VTTTDRLRRLRWPRRLILCFHAVDPTWPDAWLSTPPAAFESLVRSLVHAGYRGATMTATVADDSTDLVAAITFDDAYSSVAAVAAPILARIGWPATVFVPTQPMLERGWMDWLGADICAAHPVATAQLTPDEVGALAEQGWEVGSHGRTHRMLSRLRDDELHEELARSRSELEAVAGSCTSISYPWGEVDPRVVDAARAAGYTTGTGLAGRFTWDDPLRVPRMMVAGSDRGLRLALKTSAATWALRATPLWGALDRVRGQEVPRDLQGELSANSPVFDRR
jgi:peptidoglycan/xylan/chitin deacetylase (PgdA/CDA1 family)